MSDLEITKFEIKTQYAVSQLKIVKVKLISFNQYNTVLISFFLK